MDVEQKASFHKFAKYKSSAAWKKESLRRKKQPFPFCPYPGYWMDLNSMLIRILKENMEIKKKISETNALLADVRPNQCKLQGPMSIEHLQICGGDGCNTMTVNHLDEKQKWCENCWPTPNVPNTTTTAAPPCSRQTPTDDDDDDDITSGGFDKNLNKLTQSNFDMILANRHRLDIVNPVDENEVSKGSDCDTRFGTDDMFDIDEGGDLHLTFEGPFDVEDEVLFSKDELPLLGDDRNLTTASDSLLWGEGKVWPGIQGSSSPERGVEAASEMLTADKSINLQTGEGLEMPEASTAVPASFQTDSNPEPGFEPVGIERSLSASAGSGLTGEFPSGGNVPSPVTTQPNVSPIQRTNSPTHQTCPGHDKIRNLKIKAGEIKYKEMSESQICDSPARMQALHGMFKGSRPDGASGPPRQMADSEIIIFSWKSNGRSVRSGVQDSGEPVSFFNPTDSGSEAPFSSQVRGGSGLKFDGSVCLDAGSTQDVQETEESYSDPFSAENSVPTPSNSRESIDKSLSARSSFPASEPPDCDEVDKEPGESFSADLPGHLETVTGMKKVQVSEGCLPVVPDSVQNPNPDPEGTEEHRGLKAPSLPLPMQDGAGMAASEEWAALPQALDFAAKGTAGFFDAVSDSYQSG